MDAELEARKKKNWRGVYLWTFLGFPLLAWWAVGTGDESVKGMVAMLGVLGAWVGPLFLVHTHWTAFEAGWRRARGEPEYPEEQDYEK